MIIAFVIWSVVAVIFLWIGISCRKSKDAVGFFTFVKPPSVKDVEQYNKAVSVLWFVAAGLFVIIGIPFLLLEQNSPWFLLVMLEVIIWLIGLMIAYLKIEAKYKK